ncbi:MAG: chemotaxis protein CheX [Bdellovibrionota bacterium]
MVQTNGQSSSQAPQTSQVTKKYFEIIKYDGYLTVKFLEEISRESSKALEEQLKELVSAKCHIIMIFNHVQSVSKNALRVFLSLKQQLKAAEKKLRLILVPESVKAFLRSEGVLEGLVISGDLRGALIDLGVLSAKSFDVNFVNPFLEAMIETFKIQCHTECKPGKIVLKKPYEEIGGDLSGVIGLTSETFKGSIVLSFPKDTFLKIASNMLGKIYTDITNEIRDVGAELTNIVLGRSKVVLNERGYAIKSALPSVICGADHRSTGLTLGSAVIVQFESDAGPFSVMISVS